MGKPAAFIGCYHTCPDRTGKIPHVGGPVAVGSPNVFIGGMPAARKGDKLVCIGPPDSISSGSSGVFINGKPAARMGDSTSHGGKIIVGNGTVVIGEKCSGPAGGTTRSESGTNSETPERLNIRASDNFDESIIRATQVEAQIIPVCGAQSNGDCTLGEKCKCTK